MTTLSNSVRVCIWVLGFYKLGALGQHTLPCVLLFELWLSYCALVFISLVQVLSYMLRMKIVQRFSHWRVKANSICNKGILES